MRNLLQENKKGKEIEDEIVSIGFLSKRAEVDVTRITRKLNTELWTKWKTTTSLWYLFMVT